MNLGSCSITRAEMRGAIEGLRRTWDAGYQKVILQVDSLTAISLLLNKADTLHQHGMKTTQFQELVDKDWTVQLKHTFREGNHVADYLTSIVMTTHLGVTRFYARSVIWVFSFDMIVWAF
ncbi:Putative ribonuclease H protein At1g65750 [Linum perenne]